MATKWFLDICWPRKGQRAHLCRPHVDMLSVITRSGEQCSNRRTHHHRLKCISISDSRAQHARWVLVLFLLFAFLWTQFGPIQSSRFVAGVSCLQTFGCCSKGRASMSNTAITNGKNNNPSIYREVCEHCFYCISKLFCALCLPWTQLYTVYLYYYCFQTTFKLP